LLYPVNVSQRLATRRRTGMNSRYEITQASAHQASRNTAASSGRCSQPIATKARSAEGAADKTKASMPRRVAPWWALLALPMLLRSTDFGNTAESAAAAGETRTNVA